MEKIHFLLLLSLCVVVVNGMTLCNSGNCDCTKEQEGIFQCKKRQQIFYVFHKSPANVFYVFDKHNEQTVDNLPEDLFKDVVVTWLNIKLERLRSITMSVLGDCDSLLHLEIKSPLFDLLPSEVIRSCSRLKTLIIQSTIITSLPKLTNEDHCHLESLLFSGNKINHLPENFVNSCEKARAIDFSSNLITSIPKTFFQNCENLKSLSFQKNQIQNLTPGLFQKCKLVEEIYLNENRLEKLPDYLFPQNQSNLRFLYLQNNSLTEFPKDLLVDITRLEELNLAFNKLSNLPEGFLGKCENLRVLNLESNYLETFTSSLINNCYRLYGINLKNNRIITLPQNFLSICPRLSFIELDFNKITNIHSKFLEHCPKMMFISLSGNNLTTLNPSVFKAFPLLRILKLNKNSLHELPYGFTSNSPYLELLDVSENYLTSLAEYELKVGEMSLSQSVYNLSFNDLNILKAGTFRFSNLPTSLDLSHNNISELEDGWSLGLQKLTTLYINDNQLKSLDIRDLMLLDNIRFLNLANNKILMIERYTFVHLAQLTTLDLSQNNLNPESYFSTLIPHRLNVLNVSHNLMVHFPLAWIRSASMSVIDVSNNKISQNYLVRMLLLLEQRIRRGDVMVYIEGNLIQCPCDVIAIAEKHSHLNIDLQDSSCSASLQCPSISNCPDNCTCSRNSDETIFIDCKDSRLTSFPTSAPNVTMLDVSESDINDITNLCNKSWNFLTHLAASSAFKASSVVSNTNCFQVLSSLIFLDLGNNNISNLAENFLSGSISLESLNLSRNSLQSLPSKFFNKVSNLRILDLSSNSFQFLDQDFFVDLKSLMKLYLSANKLKELSDDLFNPLTNLAELHLERNMLENIPEKMFDELNNLQVLDLSFNRLKSIETFSLPSSLVVLLLTNNSISGTLHRLKLPTQITTLDMSANLIQKIIVEIEDFQNIFLNLHLENNQIQEISVNLEEKNLNLFNKTVMKMYLLNNPLICDCNIKSLAKLAGHKNADYFKNDSVFIVTDEVVCSRPEFLKKKLISELLETDLLCEVNSPECPKGCWCYFNESMNGIIMDCHAQPLNSLPTKFPSNVKVLYVNDVQTISSLDALSSPLYENITELWLKNCCNKDIAFNMTLFKNLDHLEKLEIDDNCKCSINEYLRFSPDGFTGTCNSYSLPPPLCKKVNSSEWVWRECTSNFLPPKYMYVPMCFVSDDCHNNCSCYLTNDKKDFVMNCSRLGMTKLPEQHPKEVTVLDMSFNNLTQIEGLLETRWKELHVLLLRNNSIASIVDETLPSKIVEIDLEFNKLQKPSGWLNSYFSVNSNAKAKIKLANNEWKCECNPSSFPQWYSVKMLELIEDVNSTYCEKESKQQLLVHSLQCPVNIEKTALAVGLSLTLSIMFIISIIVIICIWKGKIIKLWLFTHNWCMCIVKESIDDDKEFDAFISYSSEDAEFVAYTLLPGLENSEDKRFCYRICIHERDWLGGGYIPTQIMQSVQVSRRTIIVLSTHFLKSAWANLEFKLALQQALTDRINRIIVVIPDEVPSKEEMDSDLRIFITMNSYIRFKESKFWEKLRYAMPHKSPGGSLRRLPTEFINMVKQEQTSEVDQLGVLRKFSN